MAPPIKFRYEIQPIVEPGYGICPGCRTEAHLNCGYCADTPSCAGDHQRRLVGGIHRAVEHRCAFTWFDPFDIFELSNWRCYICDQATPRSLYGKRDPLSPQLDHVIPLSRGGPHTPENAECVCARCNAVKGDRTLDELGIEARRLPVAAVAAITRSDHSPWHDPVWEARMETDPIAIEARRAAEKAIEDHRRNGWRPPEPKVKKHRRARIIE